MDLKYDEKVDAAAVRVCGPVTPGSIDDTDRLDADRLVHYDANGLVLKYEFLNVRRFGVRLDDLKDRDELRRLFAEAGFQERSWGDPIPTPRRRERTAS